MKQWVSIAIVLSLAGCAVMPEPAPQSVAQPSPQHALTQQLKRNTAIDEEVLYLLLAAELAGQRNQFDLALDAYLQAAKRVDDARIAERAVKIGMFLKDEKRTQEALDIWVAKDSENLGARRFAALMAMKNSNRQSAVENLDVVLREDPAGFEGGVLEMVKLLEKEGRVPFLAGVLEDLDGLHPDDTRVLFLQAVVASVLHDNEQAQQKIARVLTLQPDWNKALIFQAQLAGRNGDLVKAREVLEKAVKNAPDDKQLRKMLLEVLVNASAYDDALKLCQSALDADPDDGDTLFAMALIYLQQQQVDKAESYLERLLRDPEWEGRASFYLGKIELEKQRPDRALAWFDRAGGVGYGFDADVAAVSVLLGQKRLEDAEPRIKIMLDSYPDHRLRLLMLEAEMYNQWGRYQESFDVLFEALKTEPDNRDLLYARALVAERLNKLDVLENDLQAILQQNRDDVGALNALGYTLTDRTQRYDEAEKYLVRALELQPEEAVIIDSYGWLLFKQGKYDLALEYLRRAYDKQAENEIAAHIAEVLWVQGKKEEAKAFFEPLYRKYSEDEYLLKFKRRFLADAP